MASLNHPLTLVASALAAGLLLLLGLGAWSTDSPRQNSIALLLKESQRADRLDHLETRTHETWRALGAIVAKLIRGETTLRAALAAYSEVYSQHYFVRSQAAGDEGALPSQEWFFEHILGCIPDHLRGKPALARQVTARLRREWHSLQPEKGRHFHEGSQAVALRAEAREWRGGGLSWR